MSAFYLFVLKDSSRPYIETDTQLFDIVADSI